MKGIEELFERNRAWAADIEQKHPGFFDCLAEGQNPGYLWIGCSDSRVPASGVVDLPPGEVFVHRNIANVVDPTDTSSASVIQFAVDVLKVRHIIVCGHYCCGGVRASMGEPLTGAIEDWLQSIRKVGQKYADLLEGRDEQGRFKLLCELNVREQCENVCANPVVRSARERGQELNVHGWIYDVGTGRLKDLEIKCA